MTLEDRLKLLFPDCSRNSLLERALERIKSSATPEQDLEILQKFTATLPEEDFLILSGVDVKVDKQIRVAAVGAEYWKKLEDIYPLFDDSSTQMVCLRANGEVWWENIVKEFVRIDSLSFPRDSFEILIKACGYKTKGMKPMVLTDAETGLKISYAANGFRKNPVPAIIIRRAVEL